MIIPRYKAKGFDTGARLRKIRNTAFPRRLIYTILKMLRNAGTIPYNIIIFFSYQLFSAPAFLIHRIISIKEIIRIAFYVILSNTGTDDDMMKTLQNCAKFLGCYDKMNFFER